MLLPSPLALPLKGYNGPPRGLYSWMLAICLTLQLGCLAGNDLQAPQSALRQYAKALSEERIEDAYALLSSEARAHLPLPQFRRMLLENPQEVRDIAENLLQSTQPSEITATVVGPEGNQLELEYEHGAWHIAASALDLYAQHTPQAAIASFVRAFENRRYDVLLQFVPKSEQHELNAEILKESWEGDQALQMERLTQALKASLPQLRVEVVGVRATVGYGAGGTVELVEEDGAWKIEDF